MVSCCESCLLLMADELNFCIFVSCRPNNMRQNNYGPKQQPVDFAGVPVFV